MPTSAQHTFQPSTIFVAPMYPNAGARMQDIHLSDGTYAKGTVLGELTASPGTFAAYNNANSNGTEVAKCILAYSVVVASGVATIAGEWGQTQRGVPAYFGGGAVFRTQELVGLDAAGVADLQASLIQGDLTTGLLRF